MKLNRLTGKIDEKRIDVLYGIRVLAIVLIAYFHIWQQSWLSPYIITSRVMLDFTYIPRTGYIWVDMFIMLSAFQLFLPYARNMMDNKEDVRAVDFYKKRMKRIIPSYYFSIIVCFIIALILSEYQTRSFMFLDLFSHLTFTNIFNPYTYIATNLNVVLWTIAILMQFYLIFPLLAKSFKKHPPITFTIMCLIGILFRYFYVNSSPDPAMFINQLPAFFDVLAIGMLGAFATIYISRKVEYQRLSIVFTILSIISLIFIFKMMETLGFVSGQANLQRWQGRNRTLLTCIFLIFVVSSSFSIKHYRWLFSNKVMVYLSSVSYNYYIWHQYIAVRLKQLHIPPYSSENPNMAGEKPWQYLYMITAFLVPLAIAIILTYLIDKKFVNLITGKKLKEQNLCGYR